VKRGVFPKLWTGARYLQWKLKTSNSSSNEQQRLLYAILEAQQQERRRISESLRNGVGQVPYATRLHLERGMLRHGLPLSEGLLSNNLFQPAGSKINALQRVKLL
jgi:signal transduction histidine kinase